MVPEPEPGVPPLRARRTELLEVDVPVAEVPGEQDPYLDAGSWPEIEGDPDAGVPRGTGEAGADRGLWRVTLRIRDRLVEPKAERAVGQGSGSQERHELIGVAPLGQDGRVRMIDREHHLTRGRRVRGERVVLHHH